MIRRTAALILVLIVTLVVGAVALAATGDRMFAPANYTYTYPANALKPACSSASHAYAGWNYYRAPAGTSTHTAILTCSSSQSTTATGWAWRAMTIGTASVP